MSDEAAVRVRIMGRVQGIGFRFWVIDRAVAMGLRGWVRNRMDGSVEAVFAGSETTVAEMVRNCRQGPSLARVERVAEEPETGAVEPGFHALPTV